jgi:hypothetical protein
MMAVKRQASDLDADTFDLYAAELAEEGIPVAHVIEACKQIGREPRAEGDTAFPSLGVLIDRCHRAARQLAYRATAGVLTPKPAEPISREEAAKLLAEIKAAVASRGRR